MTIEQLMSRMFFTDKHISQQLRKQHKMALARTRKALAGEDEEAAKIIQKFLESEFNRTDYGIYIKTLRMAAGWKQGDVATGLRRTAVGLSNNESGRNGTSFDLLMEVFRLIAPADRYRQLRDIASDQNFPVYLDVLHAIYD